MFFSIYCIRETDKQTLEESSSQWRKTQNTCTNHLMIHFNLISSVQLYRQTYANVSRNVRNVSLCAQRYQQVAGTESSKFAGGGRGTEQHILWQRDAAGQVRADCLQQHPRNWLSLMQRCQEVWLGFTQQKSAL